MYYDFQHLLAPTTIKREYFCWYSTSNLLYSLKNINNHYCHWDESMNNSLFLSFFLSFFLFL
jgi:hypothetical protein